MATEYPYLYLGSINEARNHGELDLWKESFRTNVSCARSIEDSICKCFDGMHLDSDCVDDIIEAYGFKRVSWVLSNTIQQKMDDGRFSLCNKDWAKTIYIPQSDRNHDLVVQSHPAVLDGFVNLYRKELTALQMFDRSHCDSLLGQELSGKVLVMSPFTLKESYWAPMNQLWLATGGFGCSPTASGRAVYATCLGDEEHVRWNREDFIGIIREEYLPNWAREKLKELQEQKQEQNHVPTMGGMTME